MRVEANRVLQRVGATLCLLGVICVLAPSASAVVVHEPNGHFLGVLPRAGVSPASISGRGASTNAVRHELSGLSSSGNLDYHNGPVLHSSAPYLIFWDPANIIPVSSRNVYKQYLTDVAADSGKATNVFSVDRQFTDASGFADYKQMFNAAAQVINDTDPYPALSGVCVGKTDTTAPFHYPNCLLDSQLQGEIAKLVAANRLPSGVGTGAPVYLLITPTTVNVCFDATAANPHTCASTDFCAYHSAFALPSNVYLYASIPELGLGPGFNPKACQADNSPNNLPLQEPSGDIADVAIKYLSHEDNEVITDPTGAGWYETTSGEENGDNCNFTGPSNPGAGFNPDAFLPTLGGSSSSGTMFNQLINGHEYYTQGEWSNGDSNCLMQPSSPTAVPDFGPAAGAPNPARRPISFALNPGYTSVTWNYGDGSPNVFSPIPNPAAPPTFLHTYGVNGKYTVTASLVDTHGNLATATHTVTVRSAPISLFTATPTKQLIRQPVSFDGAGSTDLDSGVSISAYSWSFGDGSAPAGGARASHAYSAAGVYTVTLTVTDSAGLTNSRTKQVLIDAPPTASFSVRTAHPYSRAPVRFDGSGSRDADGSTVKFGWNFGDHGSSSSGPRPRHAYRRPGTYTVTLKVTGASGLTATISRRLKVVAPSVVEKLSLLSTGNRTLVSIELTGAGTLTIDRRRSRIHKAETAKLELVRATAQSASVRSRGELKLTIWWQPIVGPTFRHTYALSLGRSGRGRVQPASPSRQS